MEPITDSEDISYKRCLKSFLCIAFLKIAQQIASLQRNFVCLGASRLYFTARLPLLLRPQVAKRRAGPDGGSSIPECRGSNYKIFVAKTHLYHLQQNISGEGKSQQRKELARNHEKGCLNLRAAVTFIDQKLSYSPVK